MRSRKAVQSTTVRSLNSLGLVVVRVGSYIRTLPFFSLSFSRSLSPPFKTLHPNPNTWNSSPPVKGSSAGATALLWLARPADSGRVRPVVNKATAAVTLERLRPQTWGPRMMWQPRILATAPHETTPVAQSLTIDCKPYIHTHTKTVKYSPNNYEPQTVPSQSLPLGLDVLKCVVDTDDCARGWNNNGCYGSRQLSATGWVTVIPLSPKRCFLTNSITSQRHRRCTEVYRGQTVLSLTTRVFLVFFASPCTR